MTMVKDAANGRTAYCTLKLPASGKPRDPQLGEPRLACQIPRYLAMPLGPPLTFCVDHWHVFPGYFARLVRINALLRLVRL